MDYLECVGYPPAPLPKYVQKEIIGQPRKKGGITAFYKGNNIHLFYDNIDLGTEWWFILKDKKVRRSNYTRFVRTVAPSFDTYDLIPRKGMSRDDFKNAYTRARLVAGISLPDFCSAVNKALYETLIKPEEELMNLLARGNGGRFYPVKVKQVLDNKEMLRQVLDDGNKHILPIVFKSGKEPFMLKKELGKGVWKRLCKNSFYHNTLIIQSIKSRHSSYIRDYIKYPSSLLRYTPRGCALSHALKYKQLTGLPYTVLKDKRSSIRAYVITLRDTKNMAEKLGRPFKESWDIPTLASKHEEYTREYNLLRDRMYCETIETVAKLPDFEIDGVTIKCLKTPEMLHKEGREMHHCVYSYVDAVKSGRSVIFSLISEGGRSTLEIGRREDQYYLQGKSGMWLGDYQVRQHRAECNKNPWEKHRGVEKELLSKMNELIKEEK